MSTDHRVHERSDLPPAELVEVAERIFAYVQPDGSWFINNTGFVVGDSGVVSIDTCSTERRTRAFLETIEKVAGTTARILVNTHHHGDHTNGNCLLPGSTIIGHRLCRDEIVKSGIIDPSGLFDPVDWGSISPAPPFVTFDERLDVWADDLLIELLHLNGAAHTTNDVVAWIPEHRVLFTGDLVFNGGTPFVLMGSVAGSLEALDRIMEFDATVIVPGHGLPCSPADTAVVGEYLRFVQDLADEAHRSGTSALDAARQADLGPFAALSDPERLVGNLHRALAERGGTRPGAPIDLVAAYRDMLEFNGGRPLRCLA